MSPSKDGQCFAYLQAQLSLPGPFVRQMYEELLPPFRNQTGLELEDFCLAPPMPAAFEITKMGTTFVVRGDLVGTSLGHPVVIAWSEAASCPTGYTFWWQDLPVAEIVASETAMPSPPFDTTRFGIAVDWQLPRWPHVRLRIRMKTAVDEATRSAVNSLLQTAQAEWNARKPSQGLIHSVGARAADKEKNIVVFDIDFGSTGPDCLENLLELLAALDTVRSIHVGSY